MTKTHVPRRAGGHTRIVVWPKPYQGFKIPHPLSMEAARRRRAAEGDESTRLAAPVPDTRRAGKAERERRVTSLMAQTRETLRQLARDHGHPSGGTKQDLAARLAADPEVTVQ